MTLSGGLQLCIFCCIVIMNGQWDRAFIAGMGKVCSSPDMDYNGKETMHRKHGQI